MISFLSTYILCTALLLGTCKAWNSALSRPMSNVKLPLRNIVILRRNSQQPEHETAALPKTLNVDTVTRRDFSRCLLASLIAVEAFSLKRSQAVVMEAPTDQVFVAGRAMGVDEAKARFVEAQKTLNFLVDHYDEISKGGGDNVRRYLGTVGVTSGLYGINKVLKELRDEAKDVVEFTESLNEFDYALRAADTSVYSANFVEYSAAKTKPEKFFEDARIEIDRMQVYMDEMASQLELK